MSQPVESRDQNYFELNPLERFGFNVSSLINRRNLSDEAVASGAGISAEELDAIKAGKLSAEELADRIPGISKGLGVDEGELGRLLTSELLE